MPPNVHFFVDKPDLAGVKWHRNTGKLRFCPHMLYMQAEALFHRSSDLIFLLKGVDFIMMISVKDICFGSLLVHSVFLPVPHVYLPHSAWGLVLNTVLVSCADTGHSNPTRAAFFVRIFNAVRREPKTPPNKFFWQTIPFSNSHSEAAHRSVSPRANTECGTIIKNKGNR